MTLTLYFATGSPPSRAALLTARNLGLEIEVIILKAFFIQS